MSTKRSLVMLAQEYEPLKFKAEGSYLSEKLDGVRALWLPFTRGMNFKDVPWANTARDDRNYVCSGLWTRRGKIMLAPSWWLDRLPQQMPLDGELWAGRGNFNMVTGAVRKLEPDNADWEKITYRIFDVPNYSQFFRYGEIREGGNAGQAAYKVTVWPTWIDRWPELKSSQFVTARRFNETLNMLNRMEWAYPGIVKPHEQEVLPPTRQAAEAVVAERLTEVTDAKGEGVMLRRPHSIWEPVRSQDLVKAKLEYDSEAQIIGYCFGVGKYQGMIGAFRVSWDNVVFDLSGFTDAERSIKFQHQAYANAHPGEYTTLELSEKFPIGSSVTFAYNELIAETKKPRFARYLRPHQEN